MMLDFSSIMVVFIAIMITSVILFFAFYKFSKISFKAFVFWILAYLLHALGLITYFFNAQQMDVSLIILQNSLILTADLLIIFGTNRLLNKKVAAKWGFLVLLFVSLLFLELWIPFGIHLRIAIIAAFNIIFYVISIYYTYKVAVSINERFVYNLRLILVLFVMLNILRIISSILQLDNTFQTRHILNSIVLLLGVCFHVGLLFAVLYLIYGLNQSQFVHLEYQFQKQQAIKESEQRFKQLFDQMPFGIAIHQMVYDQNGKPKDYTFLNVNKGFETQTSLVAKDILGKTVLTVIPETESIWINRYHQVVKQNKAMNFTGYSGGLDRYFEVSAYPIGNKKFVTIVHNTTSLIQKEKEVQLLSTHDYLTLLKNRKEFIRDLKILEKYSSAPTHLVLFDIDGFSIFNDAFGNDIGDHILVEVSRVLKDYTQSEYNVYRVGGDSFAVLLKDESIDMKLYMKQLQQKIEQVQYNDVYVSITMAHQTKKTQTVNAFINAVEKKLLKNKANKNKSHYSQRIDLLLETLTEKYEDEKMHSANVKALCRRLGEALNLTDKEINELTLAGYLHDIGKIAIPEEILHKPAKLTEEEYAIVKTHAEIGYRILNAVEAYQNVALATLHHHERYDGKGYPRGLEKEDIPLYSRIISVVDAYEAMVSDRVYRKALGKDYAIEELKKCSGSQFDPKIVQTFIQCIQ